MTTRFKNYTVEVSLEVRAKSADAALDRVAGALKTGYKGSNIAPVATFNVREGAPRLLDKLPDTKEEPRHDQTN